MGMGESAISYLFLFAMLLIIIAFVVKSLLYSRKYPPYIREGDEKRDSISVFVGYAPRRRISEEHYREYVFVKRKNGTYRMKCRILDLFAIVTSLFQLIFGLFILSLFKEQILNDPEAYPALAAIIIWLVSLVFFANYSQMETRLYFRKEMKRLNEL